jgi:hypothetical protein
MKRQARPSGGAMSAAPFRYRPDHHPGESLGRAGEPVFGGAAGPGGAVGSGGSNEGGFSDAGAWRRR